MIYEIIGWLGAVLILLAYLLLTLKKIRSNSRCFQILNLLGAIFVIINSLVHHALPSVGLNIIWVLIAIVGLARIDSR